MLRLCTAHQSTNQEHEEAVFLISTPDAEIAHENTNPRAPPVLQWVYAIDTAIAAALWRTTAHIHCATRTFRRSGRREMNNAVFAYGGFSQTGRMGSLQVSNCRDFYNDIGVQVLVVGLLCNLRSVRVARVIAPGLSCGRRR